MATAQANQKVFVSPGVYTSETDLSFVAQSVGVTTLGLVGESIKGPAFEPVFITNYDEFQAYFGGTIPEKFVNTQIPKYEAAYIAKSYLQQSNQMFFTRILGLSGYDAGPSWSIRVTANPDPTTIGINSAIATAPWSASFTGSTSGNTITFVGGVLPAPVALDLNTQFTLSNGSTSTYAEGFNTYVGNIIDTPSLSATTAVVYGSIPGTDYANLSGYTTIVNAFGSDSTNLDNNDLSSGDNDPWFYATFDIPSGNNYS